MSSENNRLSRFRDALLFLISSVLFLIILNIATKTIVDWWNYKPEVPAPIIDLPVQSLEIVNLINVPYPVPESPFSENNYSSVPRIVYKGPFAEVQLTATGSVQEKGDHFFLLNFGDETGILDGTRSAINKLVPSNEKVAQISGNDFSLKINLMNINLGTSSRDFEATGLGSKQFNFISNDRPSDVSKVLLAPFGSSGLYDGIIHSLRIEYSCLSENADCRIDICLPNERTTACLNRVLGPDDMQAWRNRTGL